MVEKVVFVFLVLRVLKMTLFKEQKNIVFPVFLLFTEQKNPKRIDVLRLFFFPFSHFLFSNIVVASPVARNEGNNTNTFVLSFYFLFVFSRLDAKKSGGQKRKKKKKNLDFSHFSVLIFLELFYSRKTKKSA